MGLIERFRAAAKETRYWAIAYGLLGASALGYALWNWDPPRSVPVAVFALLFVACETSHELYQRRWGTVGVMVLLTLLAATILVFMASGMLHWRSVYLAVPAACLVGVAVTWRERAKDDQRYIVPAQVRKYVPILESCLREMKPQTALHDALGRGFLAQVDQAADWLAEVYDCGAKDLAVTALYVEMNLFDINTDRWSLNGSAFNMPPAELLQNLHYNLGEYESYYEGDFVLTGMEDLQVAFQQAHAADLSSPAGSPEDRPRRLAMSAAFDLITARMQELVAAAHRAASRRGHPVGRVRVFANAHDTLWFPLCSPASR